MIMQLLDLATPTLRDLAAEAGITYHAARAYRKGQRTPSAVVLRRLAAAMRKRGGQLATAAEKFEQLARDQGRIPQPGRKT
jgi:transcriptional regulator with XRE-family HTH domain